MSIPDCYVKVSAYLKGKGERVDVSTLRDMAIDLSQKRADVLSDSDFNKLAEDMYEKRLLREANEKRVAKLINKQRAEVGKLVVGQDIPNVSVTKKFEAWLLGNSRRIGNALNLSVYDAARTLRTKWVKAVRNILNENQGDLKLAESGLLGREITQEMANIEQGGKKSVSGSEPAFRIAQVYNSVLADIFKVKQAFDPFLGKIQEYYYRQSHDRVKIEAVGKDQWVNIALSKFGEKSFPELVGKAKVQAFENVYANIVEGKYGSSLKFEGTPGDIMKKLARERVLIPNDWQSFYEYNQLFGQTNVHTSLLKAIESASHDIAVINKFGSLPEETYNAVKKHFLQEGNFKSNQELKAAQRRLDDYFASVTKYSSAPSVDGYAKFIRGFMGVQALAKLGSSYLRSWQDMANFVTVTTDSLGGNYLSNMFDAASEYMKAFSSSKETRTRAAEDAYLFSRSALHNLHQEFAGSAPLSDASGKFEGLLSSGLELQSKVSLMDRHLSSVDAAMANILSRRLGQVSDRTFLQLDPQTQQAFKRYGIGSLEWDVIRQGVEDWSKGAGIEKEMGDVSRMMNVNALKLVPDEVIAKYARDAGLWKTEGKEVSSSVITQARTKLEISIGSMINQAADAASSTAGATEAAWMFRNSDPNSVLGATVRAMWQFKSAMVKNYDTMMRSYYSNPTKLDGDFSRVARHVILSSSLWAFGETVKTLALGKTPEDPLSISFAAKALLNGGAGGIMGDAILSEVTRHSKVSEISTAALRNIVGPSISTAVDTLGVLGQSGYALAGGAKFPGKQLGNLIEQNLPFQNLFYTKAAMNYYFINGMREWLAPGYLSSVERYTAKKPGIGGDNQQYFMFKPTGSGVLGVD